MGDIVVEQDIDRWACCVDGYDITATAVGGRGGHDAAVGGYGMAALSCSVAESQRSRKGGTGAVVASWERNGRSGGHGLNSTRLGFGGVPRHCWTARILGFRASSTRRASLVPRYGCRGRLVALVSASPNMDVASDSWPSQWVR